MDTSSIITQVNRDDEPLSVSPSPEKSQTTIKKPRSRGIFSSFFCCFGNNAQSSNNAPPSNQHNTQVPNPTDHQDQNGVSKASQKYLLPTPSIKDTNKKCVVIDLDETLVHSSFKPINNADFIVPVEIDGTVHQVYVLKRPYVDEFLQKMGELFECVLFTASLAKYADPVSDLLDKWDVFRCRLFRESCVFHRGNYVKDLSRLGRELDQVIIIDNSPASYIFHPDNAVPVTSWFDDMADTELLDLLPFFESIASVDSIYSVLRQSNHPPNHNHNFIYAPNHEMMVGDSDEELEGGTAGVLHNQT